MGTSGERSIKKIDRASDKASRGLSTLGDRASGLRSRMRLLGGVVAGIAAGGGIALLINRSIAAADSIGKLSGAIGVGTDTLQELRYAAGLAGVSTGLANVAVDAGDAYERLKLIAEGDFNFEDLSLGATRREVKERKQELIEIARELKALPEENDDRSFWEWLWGTERENLTEELQEKIAIYRQWAAKLAWMQAEADRRRAERAGAGGDTPADGTTEDEKAAQERARRLLQIEKSLNSQLFQLSHEGAERIHAEHLKLVTELQHLIKPDASNLDEVE